MKLKSISIEKLSWLFGRIEVLNRSIKNGDTGIRKTPFYNMKHRIAIYTLMLCKRGIYGSPALSYSVIGTETQELRDGCVISLVLISFKINGREYVFHQQADYPMKELLRLELAGLEPKEYERRENGGMEALSGEEAQKAYAEVVDMLAENGWFIFSHLDNLGFLAALAKRYDCLEFKLPGGNINLMRDFTVTAVWRKQRMAATLSELRRDAHGTLMKLTRGQISLKYDKK